MITAIVPVSPIKSHPDTAIITETLDSIRKCLPHAEIILTFDGVRKEQESRRRDYEEHIRRVLWLADHHYGNVLPFIFDEHQHQTGMMRAALDHVETPLLLYVEQDTPLVTDERIDWAAIFQYILSGTSNVVRLHHEGVIPDDHKHLMLDREWYLPFIETAQWSQRPHIASTAYYRRMMTSHFTPNSKSFIEDRMYGVIEQAVRQDGKLGWHQHRIHIYDPGNGNMKRSYHIDGRAGEQKYDDRQIF